jgi:hypothetical protein
MGYATSLGIDSAVAVEPLADVIASVVGWQRWNTAVALQLLGSGSIIRDRAYSGVTHPDWTHLV